MEELNVNDCLVKEDLFALFKKQLKKDFSSCSLESDFTDEVQPDIQNLKMHLVKQIAPLLNNAQLSSLLYRIDISEQQIKNYGRKNNAMPFEELLAELMIKRIFQKVILKKRFSQ